MDKSETKELKVGDAIRIRPPYSKRSFKAHICYILPSKVHEDVELIVYKYYERNLRYWREDIMIKDNFLYFAGIADKYDPRRGIGGS